MLPRADDDHARPARTREVDDCLRRRPVENVNAWKVAAGSVERERASYFADERDALFLEKWHREWRESRDVDKHRLLFANRYEVELPILPRRKPSCDGERRVEPIERLGCQHHWP